MNEGLRPRGWFCFKVHGSEYMMSGLPDIICCAQGVFVGIETKNPGQADDTSVAQKLVHTKILKAEGYIGVATGPEEAVMIVEAALLDMYGP